MALTTNISLSLIATLNGTGDIGTPTVPINYTKTYNWTSGVAINQADMIWSDQRTLAASATEDLDFAGVLTSLLGGTLTLARLKAILVYAATGNTNNVQISRVATTGAPFFMADGDAVSIQPGGLLLLVAPTAAGYVVTAATDDTLTATNSAGGSSVTYDIIVVGGLT